jgi:hypothetical protein
VPLKRLKRGVGAAVKLALSQAEGPCPSRSHLWTAQFTVKLTAVLADGLVASELLSVKAFTVTV